MPQWAFRGSKMTNRKGFYREEAESERVNDQGSLGTGDEAGSV